MRVTKSDFVAEQKFDLRKLSVLIAGFTLSGLACTLLLILSAGVWAAWGCLLFLPAIWKYKVLHDAQKRGISAFIASNSLISGVVKYSGKKQSREVSELRCPTCATKDFSRLPVKGNSLVAEVRCAQCSRFLYNTTT